MRRVGRRLGAGVGLLVTAGFLHVTAPAAAVTLTPVGAGFTVTTGDLSFILKQIKIAERHTMTRTDTNPCGTLVAQPGDNIPDAEQVPTSSRRTACGPWTERATTSSRATRSSPRPTFRSRG